MSSDPQNTLSTEGRLRSHLTALLLKEFCIYLLADDLRANVILDGNAEAHLLQDKLHLLLFLHGAVCLHLKPHLSTL